VFVQFYMLLSVVYKPLIVTLFWLPGHNRGQQLEKQCVMNLPEISKIEEKFTGQNHRVYFSALFSDILKFIQI
jgi:hypothetical protein